MSHAQLSSRLVALPVAAVFGVRVSIASTLRTRLLGLAFIAAERAGPGLLIPRCRSIHTFGMRFPLEIVFIDERGAEIRRACVRPRRLACDRRAAAVLEFPAVLDPRV